VFRLRSKILDVEHLSEEIITNVAQLQVDTFFLSCTRFMHSCHLVHKRESV
jgi:hypothetical protein